MKQHILFLVGPDRCGKTNIGHELSRRLGIPYFKASSEHDSFLSSRASKREMFLNQLRYADPRVFDILKQTGYSLLFDRGFYCEYAYSKVLDRETDLKMLQHLDEMWASIGARVIFCHRSSYSGIVDDLDPTINQRVLEQIHAAYIDFFKSSKCSIKHLNVDDENLEREVDEVLQFLHGTPST